MFSTDGIRSQSPEIFTRSDDGADLSTRTTQTHLPLPASSASHPVSIGAPRQGTFRRQNSERKERLCPNYMERRSSSRVQFKSTSCVGRKRRLSPQASKPFRDSAPAVASIETCRLPDDALPINVCENAQHEQPHMDSVFDYEVPPSPRSVSRASSYRSHNDSLHDSDDKARLDAELDTTWILNLSMHFRDKSDREKFFVTYAETPTKWRRVTVSCDYRNAEAGSLEMDMKTLTQQRDKSFKIYDAIHESLPEIQFYDTVTNLKLETSEGQLHVHVTEDVNEVIAYPSRDTVRHILDNMDATKRPMEVRESDIVFDAHLSGFVYRVWHKDKIYIKKEIPSPDTIDEFLYEINALYALQDSEHIIRLEGIVVDDAKRVVKGLLISYAEQGAVVDLLYDHKGQIPWEHRERWARQAVAGLHDVHVEGYVQGDFTLSNIVVDENNDAKIIDVNRRGCPVGWEPPELAEKIASSQRISMYIGERTDLYQLGMCLWGLAMDDDEPERHDVPLRVDVFPEDVPGWFAEVVRICLSEKPRDRLSAKELLSFFPSEQMVSFEEPRLRVRHHDPKDEEKLCLHTTFMPEHESNEGLRRDNIAASPRLSRGSSQHDWTYTYPDSSTYCATGDEMSVWDVPRGRKRSRSFDGSGVMYTDLEFGGKRDVAEEEEASRSKHDCSGEKEQTSENAMSHKSSIESGNSKHVFRQPPRRRSLSEVISRSNRVCNNWPRSRSETRTMMPYSAALQLEKVDDVPESVLSVTDTTLSGTTLVTEADHDMFDLKRYGLQPVQTFPVKEIPLVQASLVQMSLDEGNTGSGHALM